jgi:hypothetical protein
MFDPPPGIPVFMWPDVVDLDGIPIRLVAVGPAEETCLQCGETFSPPHRCARCGKDGVERGAGPSPWKDWDRRKGPKPQGDRPGTLLEAPVATGEELEEDEEDGPPPKSVPTLSYLREEEYRLIR